MNFKNYMEDVVSEVFQKFIKLHPEYCSCERCTADTMVIALKKLKGMYAVSQEGEIFTKLSREDRQIQADAMVVVIEAAKFVAEHPNH